MSTFDVRFVLTIYTTEIITPDVGIDSVYAQIPYPATGKKIEGWKWDERQWSDPLELKSANYVPSIHDADTNFLDQQAFQSGIGDNDDLKLVDINERQVSDIKYWVPKVHHGHFYNFDEEWYLYSDDIRKEIVASGELLSGVFQYADLGFLPKPGVPVSARTYLWNPGKSRYEIDLNVRKKIEFTGIIDDGEELPTTVGTDFAPENIDTAKKEFILDYDFDPPRAIFNQIMTGFIGMSGQFDTLDVLGFGSQKGEYHLRYSPVDVSQPFQLITWDPASGEALTYSWSKIDSVATFTAGPSQEFKLDPDLGIVTFGDYDELTTSGAGLLPSIRHRIGAAYSYTVDLTYEPIHTRDYIEPITGDVNPLHNISNQGFLEASPNVEGAFSVHLFADMIGSAKDGYLIEQASKHNRVFARVKDAAGNELEHQIVEFEILNPIFGTFSNLDVSVTSLTNENGLATVYYVAPQTIGETSHVISQIARQNNGTTKLAIANMVAPLDLEQIYLYKVHTDDPVGGMNTTTALFTGYLAAEGIVEDPAGTVATVSYEQAYRDGNQLLEPNEVSLDDLDTGTKVIVSGVDTGVLDPSFGTQRQYELAPLIPFQATTAGSLEEPVLELTYSGQLDTIDNVSFKSYLVIADPATRIRAKVVNSITRQVAYSNIISIDISAGEAAKGVKLVPNMFLDVPSGILKRPKNADSYASWSLDDFTTIPQSAKDIIQAEYEEDRLLTHDDVHVTWSGDAFTIGYWPLNDLFDDSGYGNHLQNIGGMTSDFGYLDSGYRSTGKNYQYLHSSGIYDDIDMMSGTIDFVFRTTDNPLGSNSFSIMQITATGTNQLRNNFELVCSGATATKDARLWFAYQVSGVGLGPSAYIEHEFSDLGIIINDGTWHTFRITWEYDGWENPTNLLPVAVRTAGDDGTLDGFTTSGALGISLATHAANHGARSLGWDTPRLTDYLETTTVTVLPSTAYVGSFYVNMTQDEPTANMTLQLVTDQGVLATRLFEGKGTGSDWQRIELKGTTPSNATWMKMKIISNTNFSIEPVIYFDDFQIEKVTKSCRNLLPENIRIAGNFIDDDTWLIPGGGIATSRDISARSFGTRTLKFTTPQNGSGFFTQYVTMQANTIYTGSLYIYPTSIGKISITVDSGGGESTIIHTITAGALNRWTRLIVPHGPNSFLSQVELGFAAESNFSGNIYIADMQLEAGPWASEFDHSDALEWANPGGTISLGGNIDGQTLSDGSTEVWIPFIPEPGTISGGYLGAVVGDLTSSGQLHFDEVRYSSTVRNDDWVPAGELTSIESFTAWFKRTGRADSVTMGLIDVTNSGFAPTRLPIGFRLKSEESAVASVLDTSTFITLNDPLPSGYYN